MATGARATDGDFISIATEKLNVLLDPVQCNLLILDTQVWVFAIIPKPEWPQSILYVNDDNILLGDCVLWLLDVPAVFTIKSLVFKIIDQT